MYRKVSDFLEHWRQDPYRKPLLIQGARQVGKTYSVLAFGKQRYDSVACFSFQTNPRLNRTFDEDIRPSYLLPILSHLSGERIT